MEQSTKSEARPEPRSDKKSEAKSKAKNSEMSTVETSGASVKMANGGKIRPKKATEDEFAKGTFGFVYTLGWIGLVWVIGFGFGSGLTFLNYLRLGDTPIYFGADSFIGSNPRIIYEPNPAVYDSKSHGRIEWNPNQYHDTRMQNLITQWHHVFQEYVNNSVNTTDRVPCADFDGYADGAPTSTSCVLDLNHEDYGPCGLSMDNMKQSGMGLGDGKPCVMIRLTKLLGWFPEIDDKGEISTRECPNKEKSCCHKRRITVQCQGAPYTMYPTDGMDTCAYPYWNQKGYQAPFLMLKFNLTEPKEYNINCETNLKGLDDNQRKMKFTMKMN